MTAAYDVIEINGQDDAWHEWRSQGIGASDVATAIGLNEYDSPMSLWLRKTGQIPPIDETTVMELGHVLEPYLETRFERETGLKISRRQLCVQDRERPWRKATIDGVIDDDRIAEYKTTERRELLTTPSDAHVLQCQWQMSILGASVCYLVVMLRSNGQVAVHVIDRDDSLIKSLISAAEFFWQRVVNLDPPPVDGLGPTSAAIRQIPSVKGSEVDLTEHATTIEAFRAIIEARDQEIKLAEFQRDTASNAIRLLIGTAETALIDGEVFATYKTQTAKEYVTAAKSFRVLRFKKEKTTDE